MTTILIPTVVGDVHAASVALALKEMGHHPIRWFCQDLPSAGLASYGIGGCQETTLQVVDAEGFEVDLGGVDVLWRRRVGDPIVDAPDAEPSDMRVAANETRRLIGGALMGIGTKVFSVNDFQAAKQAENKIPQLETARAVGLTIPETLISNDPARIRSFIRAHEDSGCIYKGFGPVSWDCGDKVATLFTHKVNLAVLPSDRMLQMSPGIFQAYVPKAFEVRVTCMGAHQFAVRLDSQSTASGAVDWRLEPYRSLPASRYELPETVARKCQALMRRLGLVFGCLDLIVTPQGEHVFLEVNQMGQFLWLEQIAPKLPMLDAFCQFLLSQNPDFRYDETRENQHPLARFEAEACATVTRDRAIHPGQAESSKLVHERAALERKARARSSRTPPAGVLPCRTRCGEPMRTGIDATIEGTRASDTNQVHKVASEGEEA
ncbi:MAG TPA: hypothetical protein VGG33_22230 [Polyangia bacterium]